MQGHRAAARKRTVYFLSGVSALALAAPIALTPVSARAATIDWNGLKTDYNNGGGWTGGTVPGLSDTATFGSSATNKSLTFSASTTQVGGWTINGGAYDFAVAITNTLEFHGAGIDITSGSATITNRGGVYFYNSSTAGSVTIINNRNEVQFYDNSTAGNANITNNYSLYFNNFSTAGSATITNSSGADQNFYDSSTAGSASITNSGYLYFRDSSAADSATITTDNGGRTYFYNTSGGDTARFIINAGGTLDISGLSNSGTTAGSIEGAGSIYLGSKNLAVGGNNASTTFSGSISGSGSLTKEGTGTLTLSGSNSYAGDTTIDAGALNVSSDSALGGESGGLAFDGGALQWGASFNLASTRTVTLESGGGGFDTNGFNTTISQTISGIGGLTKLRAGTLTLSGTNTYQGGTTVSGGTLSIGSDGNLGNGGTLALGDGTTLAITGDGTYAHDLALTGASTVDLTSFYSATWSGLISGSGGVTIENGTFTPTNTANSYSGTTTVASYATFNLGDIGELGNSPTLNVEDHSTLNVNGSTTFGTQALNTTDAYVNFNDSSSTGHATANLTTFGFWIFGNTSTAGNADISADLSILRFVDSSSAGSASILATDGTSLQFWNNSTGGNAAITLETGSSLDFSLSSGPAGDDKLSVGSINSDSTSGLYLGSNALTIGGNNQDSILNGILADNCGPPDCSTNTGGSIVKVGTGTLTLTHHNTFTGGIELSAGEIVIGNSHALGTGTLTMDEGTTLGFSGGNFTITNPIVVSGDPSFSPAAGTTQTIASVISDGGTPGTVEMIGAGTLVLNAANTYTGGTTVQSGTLRLGTNGSLADSGALTVNGGTFDLDSHSQTVGALSGTGGFITLGSAGLTTNSSSNTTLASVISGTGGLLKEGSGTLTLTGTNTFTGNTTVLAGKLQLGDGGTSGSVAGDIEVFGTLAVDRSDTLTMQNLITGNGAFRQVGSGTTVLTAANTYAGGTTISAGTLQLGNGGTSGSAGYSSIVNNSHLVIDRSGDTVIGGGISGSGDVDIKLGTVDLEGLNTYRGQTIVESGATVLVTTDTGLGTGTNFGTGTLVLQSGATAKFPNIATIPNAVELQGSAIVDSNGQDASITGTISGTGNLTKDGAGTLTLTGDNSYSGGTTIAEGTLSLGSSSAAGTGAITTTGSVIDYANGIAVANAIVIGSDTTQLNTGSGVTAMQAGVISETGGSRPMEKTGDGTLILTADNSYTGGTTISAGTLQLGDGGTTGSVSGNIADNGTLVFDRSDSITYSNVISGTGGLVQAGTGTLIVTGNNTYTGGTTISAGTLQLGNGGTTGSVKGDITDNGGLVFDRSDKITYANAISGTGTLTKEGNNELILTGSSPLTGATNVAAGTLSVNGSLASSAVTVQSGATLGGTGTVGATTVLAGGTLAPGNSIGTIHVSGNLGLAANSIYLVQVSPSVADETKVTGTASVDGGLVAQFENGSYSAGTTYTLINSTGLFSGTFASFSPSNVPLGLRALVTYDAHDAYLTLQASVDPSIGQIHASMRTAFIEDERLIRDAVLGRLLLPGHGVTVWGEGFDAYGKMQGTADTADLTHNHGGGIVGADLALGDGFHAGLAGAYTAYKISIDRLASSAVGNAGHVVAYGSWLDTNWGLRGGVEFGWGNSDVKRVVAGLSETDRDSQDGRTMQVFGDAGYRIDGGGVIFEPHADIVHVRVSSGAFRETGGALSSLSGPGTSNSVTFGALGIRANLDAVALGGLSVSPRMDLAWQHSFSLLQPHQSVTIDSSGLSSVIAGLPLDQDAALAQVGADVAFTPDVHLMLGYDGAVSNRSWDNAVIARLNWGL